VLVFVDDAFSIARDRNRVLRRLAEDLDVLGPADRVAIVAFDGRRVDPLLDWSGDRAAIERALAAAAKRPAHGLRPLPPPAIEGRSFREAAHSPRRLGDFELLGQLDRLVSSGAAAMRAAGRPDGRRVMLLLSGGWPFDVFSDLPLGVLSDLSVDAPARRDLRRRGDVLFAPLVDTANLLGYTLYPVDVPGMIASDLVSAEHAAPQRSGRLELHGSLYYLAAQTGGRAMINGRRSEALQRMADDVASYYSLGFAPPRQGDDRRHAIRVDVAGRGLKVRARDSYLDLSRTTDEAMRLEGILLFADVAGGGRVAADGLEIELAAAPPGARRVAHVPVRVSFPLSALEAVPVGDAWRLTGELRVAALDGRSRLSRVPMVPIALDLSAPPRPGERFTWEGTLALRRVDQVVAASLADPLSGRTLTTRLEASP
jgi:VWFA-related protein